MINRKPDKFVKTNMPGFLFNEHTGVLMPSNLDDKINMQRELRRRSKQTKIMENRLEWLEEKLKMLEEKLK